MSSTDVASRTRAEGGSPTLVRVVTMISRRSTRLGPAADTLMAVVARVGRHRGGILAAGFAYFALLAIVPAAIALGSLAAWLGDPAALREALERAVERVPSLEGSASAVLSGLIDVVDTTSSATFGLTTVVALAFAVYASSKAFVTASQVLDLAYDRPPRERSWLVKVIAAVTVLVTLVGLVVAVVVVQSLPRIQRAFGVTTSFEGAWANVLLVAGVVTVLLGVLGAGFRFGAPADRKPRWIGPGAVLATLVVAAGTAGIGVYVSLSGVIGAAVTVLGGTLVVLLWLYVVGTAMVLGAEVDAILSADRDRSQPATSHREQ